MRIAESIADVHYVTNSAGARTDVIVPLPAWESLLAALEEMADRLEDQEDVTLLRDWLRARHWYGRDDPVSRPGRGTAARWPPIELR